VGGLDAEGQALGLDLLRDPNPRLRALGRLISEAADTPLVLEAMIAVMAADPAERQAFAEWVRREVGSRAN
jgi:hypothetical protein